MHAFFTKKGTGENVASGDDAGKASQRPKPVSNQHAKPLPWVEKHRPRTIDDIVGQEEAVSMLRQCAAKPIELPNLLFYGPPGTGKTSAALAFARKLFSSGDNHSWRERVLELNASDERGIQVVRDKIRRFAELSTPASGNIPQLRVIILDEADAVTTPAQSALRRIMERECARTRFFLICNYRSRIIAPIASRCASFRFRALDPDSTVSLLSTICENEGVKLADSDVEMSEPDNEKSETNTSSSLLSSLVDACEGDLRRAVAYLQSAWRLRSPAPLKMSDLRDLVGIVPPDIVENFIKIASTSSFDEMQTVVRSLITLGYSAGQFIGQLHDVIIANDFLTDKQKGAICSIIAEADGRLADGADDYLQLLDIACVLAAEMRQ